MLQGIKNGIKTKLALAMVALTTCGALGFAAPRDGMDAASVAFRQGQADSALRTVDASLRANSSDAAAWNLQCRIYLAQDQWQNALPSCQRAVKLEPGVSDYHRWLGHAYGEKASHAKLFSAYQTAKLVHAEFETAVSLDGRNRAALSDLGEYYIKAPKMLGGGFDKAEAIAQRLAGLDPSRADELRALIAEAKKDYSGAEQQWRARIGASKASAESVAQAWMDLGSFYRRNGHLNQMIAALKAGAAADTDHGTALVDGATTLIQAKCEPALAAQWLREYLNSNSLSEAAPAFMVHAELGDLLKQHGDQAGANREFAAAHSLSANYVETAALHSGD